MVWPSIHTIIFQAPAHQTHKESALGSRPRVVITPGARFNSLVILKESANILMGGESRRAVEVQCDCGNIFVTRYNALVTGNTKSCGCSSKYITPENRQKSLLLLLEKSTIQRTSDVPINGGTEKIEFFCRTCEGVFHREFNVVISGVSTCPHCTGRFAHSEEYYLENIGESLKGSSQVFMGKSNNDKPLTTRSKVKLGCTECGLIIERRAGHVLSRANYCHCNRLGGFNPTKPASLYLMELLNNQGVVFGYKYGIAACVDTRHRQISSGLTGKLTPWMVWEYTDGHLAQKHESALKKIFSPVVDKVVMRDGWTETFDKQLLTQFLIIQSSQYGDLIWTS